MGGAFLVLLDHILPHVHQGTQEEEGPSVALSKPVKMFLAVTLHNVPEGLAVGFAFGGAAVYYLAVVVGSVSKFWGSALCIAVTIGLRRWSLRYNVQTPADVDLAPHVRRSVRLVKRQVRVVSRVTRATRKHPGESGRPTAPKGL